MAGNPGLLTQRIAVWNQAHPNAQIDPKAEFAVAKQEGLSGGVGDNGTSFGPNQLHFGGAYPTTAPHDPGGAQAWAWSPQGLDYTLSKIAGVAGGQHGSQAVNSIVRGFERPANPNREVAGALEAYGGSGSAFTPGPSPVAPQAQVTPGAQGSPIQAALKLLGFAAPPSERAPAGLSLPSATNTPIQATNTAGGYVSPLTGAKFGRLDQGIDLQGTPGQTVNAIGDGTITVKPDPGGFGQAVYETLTSGPKAGTEYYVGHAQPDVKTGQSVHAGDPLATLLQHPLGNATQPGWTEIGPATNGAPTSPGENNTAAAAAFQAFLNSITKKVAR